jgi:hypothetical protein
MNSTNFSKVARAMSGRRRDWYFAFCLFVAFLTVAHSASAQQSVSLGPAGSLSYQITSQRIPCIPGNNQWFATNFQFSNFVYTDPSGVAHPLSGSTFYAVAFGDNAAHCPPAQGQPLELAGQGYTVFFTPTSGSGGNGIYSALINPLYQVLSLLYAAPGNTSSSGYSSGVSKGTTTSTESDYSTSSGIEIKASGGIIGGSLGVSFTWSNGNGNSQSWEETTENTTGVTLESVSNPVDHTQDQFFIWLNPQLSVVLNGPNAGVSTLGTPNSQPMDVININAEDLMNPSQIPLAVLLPQIVSGQSLPGLASICKNPLPPAQCTQGNACGCVASDFSMILAQDKLIGTTQTTLPDQVDNQRYKFVRALTLEGPQCAGCGPVTQSFTIQDSSNNVQTQSETNSYSVGVSAGAEVNIPAIFSVSVTQNSSWTWTDIESTGVSSGSSISESVVLGSSSLDCQETINVYEDTVYHTFAFAPAATPPAACN